MKTLKSKITIVLSLLFLFATVDSQAQINLNKLGNQLKKSAEQQIEHKVKEKAARETRETLENAEKKLDRAVSDATSDGLGAKEATGGQIPKGTKDIYVSVAKGSNRNDGSQSSPYKDIQKAVDAAPEGAVIHVAEGNYLGNLNRGFIEIKKYISIVGGYSDDFSSRDFKRYITKIQPPADAGGTNGANGLLDIYVRGKRNGLILIDGLVLDKGQQNKYVSLTPTDPKFAAPEGCESGILNPPGMQIGQPSMRGITTVSNQLIHGDVEGQVVIRNCVLVNGSHFGIQMGNIGGKWDIYNNVFLANRMAACEVRSMNKNPGEAIVDFHHNTVMFTWRRDWAPDAKDMGYGFRYMTGVDANVYNNIFGCSDFAALDRGYVDADKSKEAARKTSAWDNLFFNNLEADLTLPSPGRFLRIFADQFEDVEQLIKYEGNREMSEAEVAQFSKSVDAPYLKGFLTMTGTSSMDHNPNSSENVIRQALGMNMRGTSNFSVTMYANSYPYEKGSELFGALKGYGAQ